MIQLGLDKVFPSAGHHDKDSGAVANGYIERDEMKLLREMIVAELKKRNHAHDTDADWETNRQYQNRIRKQLRTGDVVVDLHLNAARPSVSGIEVFISKNAGTDSKNMAKEALGGLCKITGTKSRGVRIDNQSQHFKIGILNMRGTAILIEFGFITNTGDMQRFVSKRAEIAKFLVDLMIKYDRND